MKKFLKYYLLISAVCFWHIDSHAETKDLSPQQHYEQMQRKLATGWNTWDTRSALTHVLLPYGAAIDLHVIDGKGIRKNSFTIGSGLLHAGPHTYDGKYTDISLRWNDQKLRIESSADSLENIIRITPLEGNNPEGKIIVVLKGVWQRDVKIQVNGQLFQFRPGNLKQEIKLQKANYEDLKNGQALLNQSKADHIFYRLDLIDEYHNLLKEYQEINDRYEKLILDDSLISLQEECDAVKKQLEKTKREKEDSLMKKGSLENNLETFKEQLEQTQEEYQLLHEKIVQFEMEHVDVTQVADQQVVIYLKRFSKDFNGMKNDIEQQGNGYQRKANQIENQIVMKMKDYNDAYNIGFENALTDIESYKQRYHQLKEMDIVSKEEKTRQAKLKCEESFKTSFISGLNEKIENAKKDIAELNKGLAQRDFNGETYEFCVSPTSRDDFKEYYKIIQSGKEYMVNNLLSETLSESQRRIMDDLFIKLSSVENDQETEQMLMEYTDYRNYLDYDIKIKYNSGDFAYFSKVNKEKSGGETQTPFYVIMAASFEQVIRNRNQNEDFGCVVIFDEAFNNMDEQRIQEMIKFYNEREIQTFIAVPPSRASTIIPYVNTRLLVIKQGQQSFVEGFRDE